ncbi:putative lipocalin family protein [Vibrio phage 242E40-1]|nr:putative lipocalin family protein [Vibrio phage 242E40-1]
MKEQKRIEINFLENNHIDTGAMLDTAISVNGELFMIDASEVDFSGVTLTKSIRGTFIAKQYPEIPKTNKIGSINNTPKKSRTKTEFVKVEFNHAWEAVKEHEENKNIYHCNEGGEYAICGYDMHIIGECVKDGEIYRKVEVEIDERQEFVETLVEMNNTTKLLGLRNFFGELYDSGKFKLVE